MSPGRRRTRARPGERYNPWAQAEPDPTPAPKSPAEARTWAEWEAFQPTLDAQNWQAPVPALPYRLDWQRNPEAPPPPGFIQVRCLCGATLCRPPEWRGKAYRKGRWQEVQPSFTVGDRCEVCRAPYVRLERKDGPYTPPPGFVLAACLCHLELHRTVLASAHWQPEVCGECGAPQQQVADSHQGYRLELGEAPGWRAYWEAQGLGGWAGV